MASEKDISLVILAAGLGSRFGGVKQLAPVGPGGEVIIDYSIHDAIAAGFNKIVFILRHDIFDDFKEVLGNRLEERFRALGVKWEYVFQELVDPPEGRTKPWGTGQALMACRGVVNEPFAIINADDYYGPEAYVKAADFLKKADPANISAYGMVGFVLKNTLSDNGGVTRGVCARSADGYLTKIVETSNIVKTADGAAVQDGETSTPIDVESLVSMNLWMLMPAFLDGLEAGFCAFRESMTNPLKDEYLLPSIVDEHIQDGSATVQVLSTDGRWFGVTYKEDLPTVQNAIRALHDRGVYGEPLYADL
ncbi:MAG: NDP-sugar synthase [Oscillospiraceae bacterium]